MKLSILVPVYNEVSTFDQVLKRILDVDYPCELEVVVVDDGSRDGTSELLDKIDDPRVAVHRHDVNRGKGAAIRTAATLATGTHMTICDADLEYDPDDIPKLLAPVIAGDSEVVYGTRTFSSHTSYSFWFVLGNRGVTTFANMLFNCYIRDLETCFKLMPLPLYRSLDVRSAGFGMEAEVTGKLLRLGYRPFEVPISYRARSRAEGKKLTWRDGVEALWILSRIRLFGRA
ncbi:glycosyltransferase family 2 protein [Actinopolymorpha pittospori]